MASMGQAATQVDLQLRKMGKDNSAHAFTGPIAKTWDNYLDGS